MYAAHFGLNTLPFSAIATLENTYRSRELSEALTHISYTIENRESLLLLTGEAGCGKTTSIQVAVRKYSRSMSVVMLSHTTLTPRELLEAVAISFKMQPTKMESKPKLMQRLERHFSYCMDSDRPALVFIDEAHLLKPPVLEELRLVSDLTRNGNNLVQIVLAGQPELEKRIERNRSLSQRISVRYRLEPLSREETGQYISHRLGAAGNPKTFEIFSQEAIDAVYRLSGGLPRQINVVAGYSMMTCFSEECSVVNAGHVESVKNEYGFDDIGPPVEPVANSSPVVTTKPSEESTFAIEEEILPEQSEEVEIENNEHEEHSESRTRVGYPGSMFSLSSPKTTLAPIGLLIVSAFLVAWVLLPGRSPTNSDNTAVQESQPAARALPSQELTSEGRIVSANHAEGNGTAPSVDAPQTNHQPVPRRSPVGKKVGIVIKRDKTLAEFPGQSATIQIASILDPELADSSLARATKKTNIPGALETVPSGETTWYLVLLGYFDSAEEAEAAVHSTSQILWDMGVTEIRIKPAPNWLLDRLADSSVSRTNELQ